MNNIHSMQATIAAQKAEIEALKAGMSDLRSYLLSSKFSDDPTVQTRDVVSRMEAAESAAFQAGEDVEVEMRRKFECQEAVSKAYRHAEKMVENWPNNGSDVARENSYNIAAHHYFDENYGRENNITLADLAAA